MVWPDVWVTDDIACYCLPHAEARMRIYIAGPYTLGDPALNVREAIRAAEEVRRRRDAEGKQERS